MDWGRDAASAVNKVRAAKGVHIHYRAASQKTAKFNPFTCFFAWGWDKADRCGFVVYHADCHFVCHDSADCGGWSVTWDCNHVKAN